MFIDAVVSWIGADRLLLVLDNFEHLLVAAGAVQELLARCAGLQVIVTSQAPFRLRAERVLSVSPLPVPAAGRPATCDRGRRGTSRDAGCRGDPGCSRRCRPHVLRRPRRDAPVRHHDLTAAISWSFQLLQPEEQDLLRRLSVIAGTFALDDAVAVASDPSLAGVLDPLLSRVDMHQCRQDRCRAVTP